MSLGREMEPFFGTLDQGRVERLAAKKQTVDQSLDVPTVRPALAVETEHDEQAVVANRIHEEAQARRKKTQEFGIAVMPGQWRVPAKGGFAELRCTRASTVFRINRLDFFGRVPF